MIHYGILTGCGFLRRKDMFLRRRFPRDLLSLPGLGFKNLKECTCRLSGQAWDDASRHSQGTSNT